MAANPVQRVLPLSYRCMRETKSRRMLVYVPSLGEQTMGAKIIDRGRGPEIEGTRITVYDVMDYLPEADATIRWWVYSASLRTTSRPQGEDAHASDHGGS